MKHFTGTADNANKRSGRKILPFLAAFAVSCTLLAGDVTHAFAAEGMAASTTAAPAGLTGKETSSAKAETVTVLGKSYPADTETLDLTALTAAQIPEAAAALTGFTGLKKIILSGTDAEGKEIPSSLTLNEFRLLAEAVPEAEFDYCFDWFGQTVSTASTVAMEVKKRTDFTDGSLEELRSVLPYLRNLRTLTVFKCGTTDEAMDRLRNDFPAVHIRWVVRFAAFSAWSDTDRIWAMAGLYHDEDAENLKYFHDLKYLDIGHNGITKCDFLYGTPKLEVLILAIGTLENITPVASLKNLEYLEICDTMVEDLTPLSGCTSLEHLNLGGIPATDLTPLYSLTNLKRLFADNMTKLTDYERLEYEQIFLTLLPDAEISFLMGPAGGTENGFWRYSRGPYTGSFVPRYQLLLQQFGYDDNMNQAYVYDY